MYVKDKKSFKYVNKSHVNALRLVQQTTSNNGIIAFVDKSLLPDKFKNKIEKAGSITINPDQPLSYYQDQEFIGNSVIILNSKKGKISKSFAFFVMSEIRKLREGSLWSNKFPKNQVEKTIIKLPTKDGKINFNFMKSIISELEEERISELSAYLKVSRLESYELSDKEKQALERLPNIKWREYNLEKLFGKATRGRRLKSQDRIKGMLPFVTAGEANTGISDFIGNDVKVFDKNTITIDMFGSAKYRNYSYGCDDHIAVVHTENLKMEESIFITSAIHKTSYNGQFNYGRNFYAKDADILNILLPINGKGIDYDFMNSLISAVQKLVIKEVVIYADEKIKATKKVVRKD